MRKNNQAIIDMESNHFQFIKMGWYKHKFIFSVLMHFDIHAETGNIWIQQNNTEIQVDLELERLAEITKRHLILGFRPKYMREASDFAVV